MFYLSKNKILILSLILTALVGTYFYKIQSRQELHNQPLEPSPGPILIQQTDKPQIISTKPDPLEETVIPTTETIEITFNRTLENVGEFKVRIEPKTEYKVELSGDRKTAKIIPLKPYSLGASYTIFIGPDTKFDGVGEWRESKDFHFRTIKYTGV